MTLLKQVGIEVLDKKVFMSWSPPALSGKIKRRKHRQI